MKKILGLDLGTNSIGWALINRDFKDKSGEILGIGSRVIPMSLDILGNFDVGNSISQTAERTGYRGTRRLRERHLLRRERLHRILNVLDFLPKHYACQIDFEKQLGQFLKEKEPKIAWKEMWNEQKNKNEFVFIFQNLFNEMVEDFKAHGQNIKIPYDWTIYFLRKKALTQKIEKEELAWIILNFNQKRGYYQLRGEEEEVNPNKLVELHSLKIVDVKADIIYLLTLDNGMEYSYESNEDLFKWKDTEHKFVVTTYLNPDGTVKKEDNGNDKRSVYMLNEGENPVIKKKKDLSIEVCSLKIVDVKENTKKKKEDVWYSLLLENGWIYRRSSKMSLFDWKDKVRDFIVTTDLNDDKTVKISKEGNESRSFRAPSEDDWILLKKKTETDIDKSQKTVGTYIYEKLLQNPSQKIRGKLVRTIERKFYKEELITILKKQIELQPELFTDDLYNDCIRELYRNNEAHQTALSKRDFVHLFVNDIIFYQRPLKSQKSSIGNCSLEYRIHKINKKDEKGNPIKNVFEKDTEGKDIEVKEYLKGVPKSNPYYQEFRIWQWLYNLKIYTREDNIDVTTTFIKNTADLEKLFEFLMSKKEVGNKDVVEFLIEKNNKNEVEQQIRELYPKLNDEKINQKVKTELAKKVKELLPKYRWNYVFDNTKEKEEDKSKEYPCNETGYEISRRLKEVKNVPIDFLETIDAKEITNKKTNEKEIISLGTREYQLWHIIYSVTDKNEFKTALGNFAKKYNLDEESFVNNFEKFKLFKNEYGSFSEKAIKKLLPLMRLGKYWSENAIFDCVKERATSIKERLDNIQEEQTIDNVADDVQKRVLKSFFKFKNTDIENFVKGLQLYQASYLVYGRHSEAEVADKWKMSYDIQKYLYEFRQHDLRNPIVEQVITETLRVVKDIWEHNAKQNNIQPIMVYDEHKKKEVKSYPNIFDEIHIELGREMKNTAEDRKAIANSVLNNETTNLRIKAMLIEFANDDSFKNQIDYSSYCKEESVLDFYKQGNNPVRPYSQTQHDILKIYEEYVLNDHTEQDLKNEKTGLTETKDGKSKEITIYDISQKSQPTKSQIEKYKLWLEQKYRSPYTGQMISLTQLFTPIYEIEHIIPKSRYFDDSLSNKVICEAEVNKLKDNRLGLEFIKNFYGHKVQIGKKTVEIFTEIQYKNFVNQHYKNNNKKRKNLLLEEIPDKMIDRQLNDTRHISKFISKLLSNIVRNETNDDGVNSTNLIPVTGKITSKLKQGWGLNDKWNELILPRFERMNQLTNSSIFTTKNKEGHTIPAIPLEYSKGFQFKRIDHRHHALDALVIACTTREHVQYLNNENAKSQKFHLQRGLAKQLREFETVVIEKMVKNENGIWVKSNKTETREVPKSYFKPWDNFTIDARNELEKIVVSFKQNLRVINKTTNKYEKIVEKNGKKIKEQLLQTEGDSWAIRKPLHTPMPYGKKIYDFDILKIADNVGKREFIIDENIKSKIEAILKECNGKITEAQKRLKKSPITDDNGNLIVVTAFKLHSEKFRQRQPISKLSNRGLGGIKTFDDAIKFINKVADFNLRTDLLNHLKNNENNIDLAFSAEGIERFNTNRKIPVYKLPIAENGSSRFRVGNTIGTQHKWVEAETGTNLFFAIYADENGIRSCETIPLNIVIERLKQGLKEVPETNEKGHKLSFHLSPNDLVYVPTEEERGNICAIDWKNLDKEQLKRIYKMVSSSGNQCFFIRQDIATSIVNKLEFSSSNKMERAITGEMIKDVGIKITVDRIGLLKNI